MRIVVFISGRGSNLEALLNKQHQSTYEIAHVISNQLDAEGLTIAQKHGIKNSYVLWDNPYNGEQRATELLQWIKPDLIVLAGFMKVLSLDFVTTFKQKIINIHPSLLPLYPGLNTHQRAIDGRQKQHGASIHLIDEHLDQGTLLTQTIIDIRPDDTAITLASRLLPKEHLLLTETVKLIAEGKLTWHNVPKLNGKPLIKPLVIV